MQLGVGIAGGFLLNWLSGGRGGSQRIADDSPSQERILVKNEELENRRQGREQILKVYVRKVPLAPDVNLKTIARGTPGFSGADLMNLVSRKSARLVTVSLPRSAAMRPTSDIRRHRHHG